MDTFFEIWNTYKGDVIPVLVTAIIATIPVVFFWIRSRLKTAVVKNELVVENLKQLNQQQKNSETTLNAVAEQSGNFTDTVKDIKQVIAQLAQFMAYAFENSNVSPKLKADLRAMAAEFTTNDLTALETLTEQINMLKDENDAKAQTIHELEEKTAPTLETATETETPAGYTPIER